MVGFVEKTLTRADGGDIGYITHMEIGPDGLLYASSVIGTIYAFSVETTPAGEYVATLVHQIDSLLSIQNHNDDGSEVNAFGRTVMGFDVVGTADNPVIFVTSNDPRIDTIADANSGTLHMISLDNTGTWNTVDLVRGLPRSQHDHQLNGVEYAVDDVTGLPYLLVNAGGMSNAGATSAPLNYMAETAYSGAVLKVDLGAILGMTLKTDVYGVDYYYNLPTLDDPTRAGVTEGVDASIEIYGSNGGLNQAKLVVGGPVQIYAPGIRNAVETIETEDGNFLTFDNGGNPSWGREPIIVGGNATNLPTLAGSITTNQDQLHLVVEGVYMGHPNPTRASGSDAGLYQQNASGIPLPQYPTDYASVVPESMQDPAQGFFLAEGTADGALALSSKSTNGLTEYTFAGAFGGEAAGDIFAVRYATNSIIRIKLSDTNNDGIPDTGVQLDEWALGIASPLDVHAPTAGQILFGTLLVSGLTETGSIRILVPDDGSATNPIDPEDRDTDGINDRSDAFAMDAENGMGTTLAAGQTLHWEFESTTPQSALPGQVAGFRIGLSGIMSNGTDLPETLSLDRFEPVILGGDDVVLGGTANTVLIGATPGGSANGAANTQFHGFQAGFSAQSDRFTITAEVWNQFRNIPVGSRSVEQKSGFYLGTGDQDSFISINIGMGFMELRYEENGVQAALQTIALPQLLNVNINTYLTDLTFAVDRIAGTISASYVAQTLGGPVAGSFAPVQAYGDLLDALHNQYAINGHESGVAWGLMATSGSATPFEANFGEVTLVGADAPITTGAMQVVANGASTYNGDFFSITNTGSQNITQVVLTIAETLVPDLHFSVDNTSGTGSMKAFTVEVAGGTGVSATSDAMFNLLPAGGYQTLVITLPDFNPGETFAFTIDVNPRTSAGFAGGNPQGSISGLEMAGTVVSATFADGSHAAATLVGTALQTAVANVRSGLADAVTLSLAGYSGLEKGVVGTTAPVLTVTGTPGARVAVLVGNGDALPDDATGDNLFPGNAFGFNAIENLTTHIVMLDATGHGTVTLNLTDPDPADLNDAVFRIAAAQVDAAGQPVGLMSRPMTVLYSDSTAVTAANDSFTTTASAVVGGNLFANDNTGTGPLSVTAVNGVTAFVGSQITLGSGALLTVNADGTFSYNPNGAFAALHGFQSDFDNFTYTASNPLGFSDSAVALVEVNGEGGFGTLIKAINIGGGAFASVDTNILFAADPGVSSGTVTLRNRTGVQVLNTADDPLYQTYAFGTFGYDIAVPVPGEYAVTLFLAEPFFSTTASRIFDVALEDDIFGSFNDIDARAEGGAQWGAFALTEVVTVTDGVLDLDVVSLVNNGFLSAFSVHQVAALNLAPINLALNGNTLSQGATPGTVVGQITASDPDGDAITYGVNDARFVINASSQLVVASGASFAPGPIAIILSATDGQHPAVTLNTSLTVSGGSNLPPVVTNDTRTATEDTTLNGSTLLANDSDPEGQPLSVTAGTFATAQGGSITLNANGTFAYTPAADFNGSDTFNYVVRDGVLTSPATLTLNVGAINDAPRNLAASGSTIPAGAIAGTVIGVVSASDPEGNPITYATNDPRLVINGANQIVVANGAVFNQANVNLLISASDGIAAPVTITKSLTVGNPNFTVELVNTATEAHLNPIANGGSYAFSAADLAVMGINVIVPATGSPLSGAVRSVVLTIDGQPAHLENTAPYALFADTNGNFNPGSLSAGAHSLVVSFHSARNGGGTLLQSQTIGFTLTTGSVVNGNDAATVSEDTATLINVLANDGAGMAIATLNQPLHGTAVIQAGQVLYTPAANYFGTDAFTYTSDDGAGGAAPVTATVSLSVTNSNDNPTSIALSGAGTVAETAVAGTIIGQLSGFDADNDTLVFTDNSALFTVNGAGQLVVANGAVLAVTQNTIVPVQISANDGHGGTAQTNVNVTILDGAAPPAFGAHYNVGGGAFTAANGSVFAAPPALSNGTQTLRNAATQAVSQTTDDALYQTYAFGTFGYDIALPAAGTYHVTLYLAETFFTTAGSRLFDVALEGSVSGNFNDIDVFALTGARWEALTLTQTVTVSDGVLDLDVISLVNNGLITGFSVTSDPLLV